MLSNRKKVIIGLLAIFLLSGVSVVGVLVSNYHQLGNLIQVVELINTHYIEDVNSDQLVNGAIKGIVESLDDPYSSYLDPKDYTEMQQGISGTFGGIGITVGMRNDHITVIAPIKGTPAYQAGIKADDVITKINDETALDMELDKAVDLMRGEPDTEVKIEVMRKTKDKMETLKFTIVREIINVPTVEGKVIEGNIGYIQLSHFNSNTHAELEKVLAELTEEKIKGIILDLRFNPGGELQSAIKVADKFVEPGVIVSIREKNGNEEVYRGEEEPIGLPLVVLVNGNSASASEIVSGAIKDTNAGTLVGTKTFGKGVVQSIYSLKGGAGLKLTMAKYYTPAGTDIHKKGIEPHVKVEQDEEAKQDLQLEKAKEIIKGKI